MCAGMSEGVHVFSWVLALPGRNEAYTDFIILILNYFSSPPFAGFLAALNLNPLRLE
jgi:hypothetical protein